MELYIEPSVRRLVAQHLGVGLEDLGTDVSLRDDLAADSLDLVEVAMALEAEFAIVVPELLLDQVRTYGDLVRATAVLVRMRSGAEARGAKTPPRIWVRIVPLATGSCGTFERTGWLTPYTAETIAEDALRAGRGARLEVTIAASTASGVAQVRQQFAGLGARGIEVIVREDRPAEPPARSTTDRPTEQERLAASARDLTLTHRLLDELTGAPTTVSIAGYVGDDPWQADDLVAGVGQHAKRFGDATPAEQAEALSGSGPCRFVDGDPRGHGYRATTEGHHVHAQFVRPSAEAWYSIGDVVERTGTRVEIGPGNARFFQTDRCTGVGPEGQVGSWQEATFYSQDRAPEAFSIGSSLTRLTSAGYPAGRPEGLRAQFALAAPPANGFRARTATLEWAGEEGACTLLIVVSAHVAGREQFAEVALHRGPECTLEVRLLPPA
jgi:acyl carrier protein